MIFFKDDGITYVVDENGLPIFGTTKIQPIVETMNSEYEIFSEDFEKVE